MWFINFMVGLLTGVLAGFGIGGGTLLVLWLTLTQGISQLNAGGINLLYFVGCALPALVGHVKNKLIDKSAFIWCTIFGLPFCIVASIFAAQIDVTLLRRIFGAFLLIVGIREIFSKKKEPPKSDTAN